MSESWNVSKTVQLAPGQSIPVNSVVSAAQQYQNSVAVTPAAAGTLTTRSSNTGGVVTLSNGHDVVNGRCDVYWSGGSRYGVTVSVSGNAATISGGSGDNLPVATTAVNLKNPQSLTLSLDGTVAVGVTTWSTLGTRSTNLPGRIVFESAAPAVLLTTLLTYAAPNYEWDGSAADTPINGTVTTIYFSQGNTDRSVDMGVNVLYN